MIMWYLALSCYRGEKLIVLMQALREELRRQRSSIYVTAEKDEGMHHTPADSEHSRHLESQIAEYKYFTFVINVPQ